MIVKLMSFLKKTLLEKLIIYISNIKKASWAAEQGGHWGTVPPHFCKNQENVPFFHKECALWKL